MHTRTHTHIHTLFSTLLFQLIQPGDLITSIHKKQPLSFRQLYNILLNRCLHHNLLTNFQSIATSNNIELNILTHMLTNTCASTWVGSIPIKWICQFKGDTLFIYLLLNSSLYTLSLFYTVTNHACVSFTISLPTS